ncbi:MAG: hypothetical protein U9R39_00125 [Campylobacterota bacterium]|nr:hypothetical protein [Campylobacterota bacterium]
MASDLSKLIQDGLCSTLTALLSKDAELKETTKVHENDLLDIQTLKIDSTFEFADITSTWSFIIPANSASYVFNAMLGDTSDPVDEIDADITDAIHEFISNVSGGLSTIINGSDLEDLGSVKSSTTLDGIIERNQIEEIDNMFKLLIDLDGFDITVFITFDKVILPFIDAINQSEVSFYPEEDLLEEMDIDNTEIENLELSETETNTDETKELENSTSEDTQLENKNDNSDQSNKEDGSKENIKTDEKVEEVELTQEEQKTKKLKKLIIIIAGLIALTITTGLVMYFMGMFDPAPVEKKDTNETKVVKNKDNVDIVKYDNKNLIKFSPSQINIKRLNARLEELTKHEILSPKEIEEQNNAQKERLANIKKEAMLIEFSKLNKEEKISPKVIEENKENLENNTSVTVKEEEKTAKEVVEKIVKNKITPQEEVDNKLKFILVHSLKYKLFKEMILKTDTKKARISICKDTSGRTAVYIGPFENESSQTQMIKLIKEKQSNLNINLSNITQEEFNKRCNF